MTHKIWIELEKASTFEEAEENCRLANAMLRRLGVENEVFFASDNQKHAATFYNKNEGGGAYTELKDRGAWFNLDYLGREDEQ